LSSEEILYEGSTTWGWENFGRKVANRNMDVFIDPWMDGRWGSQFYDAEGILARKRVLIKDGVVQGYIADRNGAYHLSRLVGENIMPGDSRFMISSPEDVFVPEPRISNLDVVYKGSGRPKTKSQMWLCFMDHLKKQRTEGIYFPDKAGGESDTTNGLISCTYDFPYIVRRDGTLTPTKFLSTESDAQTFLRNIKLMGEPRVYTPHFCGDDVYQPMVRAGLRCGSGIVRNIHVVPERKVGRRQKMY
jgi:TldD protein